MNATLLIELRTEELPPKALEKLSNTFAETIFAALGEQALLSANSVCTPFATPRRLALSISQVADWQADRILERKGPAVNAALDADGKPSKALQGFMRSAQVTFEQLQRVSDGKAEYFVAHLAQKGQSLAEVLQPILLNSLKKLPIPRLMRWGDSEHQFVRPVHGLLALHGEQVVPLEAFGLHSSNVTFGHRFLAPVALTILQADEYAACLQNAGKVQVSFAQRRALIAQQLEKNAAALNAVWIGHANFDQQKLLSLSAAERSESSSLLDEVTALVEAPAAYIGEFEAEYLDVPAACLILTMQQNQKYFPLLDKNGNLLNKFIIISNMPIDNPQQIIQGNQRVVRPRLADARFFYQQDRKLPLAARVEKLAQVVYHNKLGSQLQRVERIASLAGALAAKVGANVADAQRAARLCKADLITDMVGEFPELQGVMGRDYALHDGEKADVAQAIEAHYRPRFAGDALPATPLACAVALADKLETLLGIYGIGQVPTGDKDPFGLRRHALGVLRILIETPLELSLSALLKLAADNFPAGLLSTSVAEDVAGFMLERLRGYLREREFEASHIEAVLAALDGQLHQAVPRLLAVRAFAALPAAKELAAANKRVQNMMRKNQQELGAALNDAQFDPQRMTDAAERELFQALAQISPVAQQQFAAGNYAENLASLVTLKPFIDDFFDQVMVMAEDPAVRTNRALLLQQLGNLMNQVADIAKLAV